MRRGASSLLSASRHDTEFEKLHAAHRPEVPAGGYRSHRVDRTPVLRERLVGVVEVTLNGQFPMGVAGGV